jgi:hypothetical protein
MSGNPQAVDVPTSSRMNSLPRELRLLANIEFSWNGIPVQTALRIEEPSFNETAKHDADHL